MPVDEILEYESKIKTWLLEEYDDRITITKEDRSDLHFFLTVTSKEEISFIQFYILTPKGYSDRIVIHWAWTLLEEYVKSLNATPKTIKKQLYSDLQSTPLLMNVAMRFKPSIEDPALNLVSVDAQKKILVDGLTKDRFIDVLENILNTFIYVVYLFERNNLSRPQFEPSSLI
jgi:hypothetical protein